VKIAFVTAPPEEAGALARRLVEASLAACVNILFGVTSVYRWQGRLQTDNEALLIAKVADDKSEEFAVRVKEWHPYQVPEVVLIDVTGGNPDYLAWVAGGS
jgi:periplasmic divalent cation tolerance protein